VETVADTLEWLQRTGAEPANGWGLSAERETELLAAWRARS
jgi:hypothetical protein